MKQLTLILLLIVALGSCKKNTVDFNKYSNLKLKPEVLTPLANAKIRAGELLKEDSIIKYDPNGLIRLTFMQDSVFNMDANKILKNIYLGKNSSKFSIGTLNFVGKEIYSSISLNNLLKGATQQKKDLMSFMDGKKDTFPEFVAGNTDVSALTESNDYEYLKLSKGHLVFNIINEFPTELSNLEIEIYDSVTSANPVLLGTAKFNNVPSMAAAKDSINIGGRTLSNKLGYSVPNVLFSKSQDSVFIDLTDELKINVTFSGLTCIGGKAQLPAQTIPTETLSIDLSDPSVDAMLRNIEFGTAKLPVITTSTFNTDVNIDISLPDASRGGNSLSPLNVSASTGTINSEMDLSNANIYLGSDPLKDHNILRVSVATQIEASNGLVEFDSSDFISIEFDASTAEFEYLDGYLGRDTFDISIDDLDVSQLAELGRGITMENPKMEIFVTNSFGIPILVKLDITAKDENAQELPMNAPNMSFPFPSITERGTLKSETFSINKDNSDIVECLGMPATTFDIKGQAIMNPDGFTGFDNHITQASAINLGFAADIPMTFTAKNFSFIDTIPNGATLQGLEDFDLLELKIKTLNGFPLGGSLDLIFTDAQYNTIDSLVDVTLLESAVVDNQGQITSSTENMTTFLMTAEMLDKLNALKCENILIRTNFSSYDNGNVPVSIFTSCTLDITLAFRAIYEGSL